MIFRSSYVHFLWPGLLAGMFCWTLLLGGAAASGDKPVRIVLHAEAAVDGEMILLGRIAELNGFDSSRLEQLKGMEIGRAPLPGQSFTIHPSQIERRLKQSSIAADAYSISDQGPIRVVRNATAVTAEQIQETVKIFIETHAPWSKAQMKIRPIQYSQEHALPVGHLTLQATAPKHTDWLGGIVFSVQMQIDHQTIKRVFVPAYVEVWQDVVLAAKPLGRNQPVLASDLKITRMNMARVPANAVLRTDQAIGRSANRSIAINSILRFDQIDTPPVVRRGDRVQVLAQSALLTATTQGVAQENGVAGDSIRVMNLGSKKSLQARVVDAQTVRVDF
ncbi:MAG: hypothetical protein VR64_16985 [Desulfatitalea sp. BRH_c12]|nr:MAG: hypothetical protein VR64_16985 [Desulfatitalea sp. BRH_c12]